MRINPFIAGLIGASIFIVMGVIFSRMGILFMLLVFFGSLPVYISALGWGRQAAVSAILGIAAFSAIASSPNAALLISLIVTMPAALAGYQANLAQQDKNGELVWYPVSMILLWMTVLVAGAALISGIIINFDPPALGLQIAEQLQPFFLPAKDGTELSIAEISQAMTLNLKIMPFILPSLWLGIHIINFLLGMKITRRIGVLVRPPEDMVANFNLPQFTMVIAVFSLAGLAVAPPPLSYGFAVIAGSTIMAFSIVGLAAMHLRTREWDGRKPMLVAVYIIVALAFFPVYLFSISGFMKSMHGNREHGKDSNN